MENELPLDFNGPFHKSEIKSNHKQDFLNKPGVYIWGFMYAYKSTSNGSLELNDPIDFKEYPIKYEARKMLFIPYYVGISTTTLFERLNKHQNVRCDPSTKYTRLSIEYIKKFFKNEKPGELDFPINIKGKSKKERNNRLIRLIKKYKKSGETSVTYFNDLCILNEIYNPKDKKSFNGYDGHWPITNQFINNNPMSDPLNELVSEKNNFWFYFAEYENPYKLSVDDSKDEILKKKYKKAQEELYEKIGRAHV